jgi:hypothetical protein
MGDNFEMKNENSTSIGKSEKWFAKVAAAHPRRKNAYGAAIGAAVGLCILGIGIFSNLIQERNVKAVTIPSDVVQVVPPDVSHIIGTSSDAPLSALGSIRYEILAVDPSAQLNPSWRDRYSWQDRRAGIAGAPLSKAGYPIIVTRMPIALCKLSTELEMARDLIVAGQISDAGRLNSCVVIPTNVMAEWVEINAFDRNIVKVRLHLQGQLPIDLYGPSAEGSDNPLFGWFGTLNLKQ